MLISIDAILYLDWLSSILWEIHASSQSEWRIPILISWDIRLSIPLKINQLQRRILWISVLTIVVWKKGFLKVLLKVKSRSECLCVCVRDEPPKVIKSSVEEAMFYIWEFKLKENGSNVSTVVAVKPPILHYWALLSYAK